jgi:diguanylate cyclase (GGDEF)-like protein
MKNPKDGSERPRPLFMLTAICISAGSLLWALTLARRTAAAEATALVDPLTGAFNRRGGDALIDRETARAQRAGTSMTIFIMDIDQFKVINDRFGHQRGDRILRDVAGAIRSSARAGDVLARIGGDEFALLAVDDGSDLAEPLLGRLEAALAPLGVNVSVGFATAGPGEDPMPVMERADQQMYQNKAARRAVTGTSVLGVEAFM